MCGIDAGMLGFWLREHLSEDPELYVRPISGGQSNPTFFVNCGRHELLLRKKPS